MLFPTTPITLCVSPRPSSRRVKGQPPSRTSGPPTYAAASFSPTAAALAMSSRAALAALADRDHRARVREQTLAARTTTAAMFEEAGYQTVPSQANFILVRTPDPGNLADALAVHGVSVRPGQALGVPGAVRVSVPSQSGLARLKQALTGIGGQVETTAAADPATAPTPSIQEG